MLLYVRRDRKDYQGRGAQDGRPNLLTAPELSSSVLLYVHRDHKDYQGREYGGKVYGGGGRGRLLCLSLHCHHQN